MQLTKELKKRGLDCFADYNEISFGKNIPVSIKLAIKRSKMVLLITTKDIHNSKWIPKEIEMANNGRRNIIPINFEKAIETPELAIETCNVLRNSKA